MPALQLDVLTEPLVRVLADDLEHREAIATASHEALVDERAEILERRVADRFRGSECPASGEDAEPREQLLGARLEQVVAPVERHAQRLLMLRRVAAPAGQQ